MNYSLVSTKARSWTIGRFSRRRSIFSSFIPIAISGFSSRSSLFGFRRRHPHVAHAHARCLDWCLDCLSPWPATVMLLYPKSFFSCRLASLNLDEVDVRASEPEPSKAQAAAGLHVHLHVLVLAPEHVFFFSSAAFVASCPLWLL